MLEAFSIKELDQRQAAYDREPLLQQYHSAVVDEWDRTFRGLEATAKLLLDQRERTRNLAARLESELAATQQTLAKLVKVVREDPDGPTPEQLKALDKAEAVLDSAEVEL